MKMDNKTIENHQIKTEEHLKRVDGHVLKEKMVTTSIEGRHSGMKDNYDATEIVEYSRSIENHQNRRLVVTEHFKEGFITGKRDMESTVNLEIENGEPRQMTKEDMEQFEKDWVQLSKLALNQWPASFDTQPNLPN